jgi:hypothetical protein
MNNELLALLIDELRFTMSLEILLNVLTGAAEVLTGRSRHMGQLITKHYSWHT